MFRSPHLLRRSLLLLSATGLLTAGLLSARSGGQAEEARWKRDLTAERIQKDLEFRSSTTSPMAGVARLNVPPEQKTWIQEGPGGVTLSPRDTPTARFSVLGKNGEWRWDPRPGSDRWTLAGKVIVAGTPLPDGAAIRVGRFTVVAHPSQSGLALSVFDPERQELKAFKGLLYFSPDRRFAVQATLEKFRKFDTVKMLTSRNLEKTFYRYARVHFTLGGKKLSLTAYKSALTGAEASSLFIPFRDKTTGSETYGVGRFLELAEPSGSRFTLDFNRAFNPLCNYSPVFNCPIPPSENELPVAIRAGERTYPGH